MPNQYENEQNVEAHFRTTGPEIWRQTEGQITHLFVSLGTCGTVTGTEPVPAEQEPRGESHRRATDRRPRCAGPAQRQQLGVSKLFDPSLIDDILEIDYELAYTRALELCQTRGAAGRAQFRPDLRRRAATLSSVTKRASA